MGGSWIIKWILADTVKYSYLEGRLVFDSHNVGSSLNMSMKREEQQLFICWHCLAASLSLAFYLDFKFFTAETIFHPLCTVSHIRGYCPWLTREGSTNNNISWLGAYRGYHCYKLQTKLQSSEELRWAPAYLTMIVWDAIAELKSNPWALSAHTEGSKRLTPPSQSSQKLLTHISEEEILVSSSVNL